MESVQNRYCVTNLWIWNLEKEISKNLVIKVLWMLSELLLGEMEREEDQLNYEINR